MRDGSRVASHECSALAWSSRSRNYNALRPDHYTAAVHIGRVEQLWTYPVKSFAGVPVGGFDAIAILDVLYLLPPAQKREILARCRALLAPGGTLLLKTNDTSPRWKYRLFDRTG